MTKASVIDQQFAARILGYAETPAGQAVHPQAEHLVDTLLDALERAAVAAESGGAA